MRVRLTHTRLARPAFTLMEMMVVVAIIVILGGIAVVAYTNFGERGNEAKVVSDIKQIDTADYEYYLETGQLEYPPTLEALVQVNKFGKVLLKPEALRDPWGQPYHYDLAGGRNMNLTGENKPDIWCDRGTYHYCNWKSGKQAGNVQ